MQKSGFIQSLISSQKYSYNLANKNLRSKCHRRRWPRPPTPPTILYQGSLCGLNELMRENICPVCLPVALPRCNKPKTHDPFLSTLNVENRFQRFYRVLRASLIQTKIVSQYFVFTVLIFINRSFFFLNKKCL